MKKSVSQDRSKSKRIIINIERRTLKIIFILNIIIFIGSFIMGFLVRNIFDDEKTLDTGRQVVVSPVVNDNELDTTNDSVSSEQDVNSESVSEKPVSTTETPTARETTTPTPERTVRTPTERTPERTTTRQRRSYTIQVISIQDYNEAINVRDNLRRFGLDARVVEAELASGKWYRIRIGSFASESEATREAKKIEEKGIISSFLIWQE